MKVDFKDLLTFLKIYSLRRFCLEEHLLELGHMGREERWHPRPSKYYRLTAKGRGLLEIMRLSPLFGT